MPTSSETKIRIPTLAEWSEARMAAIFEASTEEDALKAIADTFPDDVKATLNGNPLPRPMIDKFVLVMRPRPEGGLKVHWKEHAEAPKDPEHRNGSFGGFYYITGLIKPHPVTGEMVPFIRYKTVTVKIESLSDDLSYDSRKITELVFVGSDRPVDP
ncbi:hypothetical protein GYMLUDRAFT_48050 [Collybiopsis luxurians FD-317 M1]|uniref:Uncharacterized protein n=1 Tax=Collybiopsis luxurians FD-317 M1 TaxID=944289 RepID=A0A0D0AX03_9AGAR|nr:hypothetical protein GYMLUDRAFT_48050 [Collybiopsis luxurians FD-317 M1]